MIGQRIVGKIAESCVGHQAKSLSVWLVLSVIGTANADNLPADWVLSPGLSITGAGKYHLTEGVATRYNLLAATAELEIRSPSRPYYGGLFADYRLYPGSQVDNQVNLGAFARYDLPQWDFTAYVFSHRSLGQSGTAMFAGRVRYRIRGNNKIGFEYMSTLENRDFSDITVAYYGSISDSLSFNIGAGRGIAGGPDLQVRVEISWQVR